jgi:sugar/nucleoside kinase (ribokinase family)
VNPVESSPALLGNRRGLLAGGNWIIDHVKIIDAWPPQDALASISREWSGNGGAPYNVLKNLAKLGASFPLAAVGLVGDDNDGRAILADCRAHGIDAAQLETTPEAPTSYTDVMTVKSTGRRTFFHQRGANALLGPGQFDFGKTRARLFHLGYLLLLDRLDAAGPDGRPAGAGVLSRARAAGLATSLDCVSENSDRLAAIANSVLPEVDYFFANDFETEKVTGVALRRAGEIDANAVALAAQKLIEAGVRRWAILHFPEAVFARSAEGLEIWQPSLRVPAAEIKGAAGAGDALAAGVLYGLHEGWPMERSLHLGVCVAAASLRHPTCSEGICPLDQCLALANRLGFRANAFLPRSR